MRFVHTGDWHLGKSLIDRSLADDQRFTLNALLRLAEDLRPDAIVVAGDVFDRAVPPTAAVERLNDVLGELALRLEIPVVIIAGNHDSPIRLQFLSGVIGRVGLHVVGEVGDEPTRSGSSVMTASPSSSGHSPTPTPRQLAARLVATTSMTTRPSSRRSWRSSEREQMRTCDTWSSPTPSSREPSPVSPSAR